MLAALTAPFQSLGCLQARAPNASVQWRRSSSSRWNALLCRLPLKAQKVSVGIADIQLLHAVGRDFRWLHINPTRFQMTIRRIDVRTAEVERRVGVCRCPTCIWPSRTVKLFVRGIEHYLRVSESQQPPIELIPVTRRRGDELKSEHVSIEAHRCRHVEHLQQCANPTYLDAHRPPSFEA